MEPCFDGGVFLEVSEREVVISVNLKMSPFDTLSKMSVLVDCVTFGCARLTMLMKQ